MTEFVSVLDNGSAAPTALLIDAAIAAVSRLLVLFLNLASRQSA